jgi:hypothetical protein
MQTADGCNSKQSASWTGGKRFIVMNKLKKFHPLIHLELIPASQTCIPFHETTQLVMIAIGKCHFF